MPNVLVIRKSFLLSIHSPYLTVTSPKKEKYPEGYPGDVDVAGVSGSSPKRRKANWNCEKCDTPFKDPEKPCDSCGHVRCNNCPRGSPTKAQTPEEKAAIQAVEERMRRLDVSPQAPAA